MTAFDGGIYGDKGPSLRRRILYTFLLLLLFRLLAQIPAANVDEEKLHHLLAANPLAGVIDLFAGGEVMTHFSVVSAGIVPFMLAFFLVEFASLTIPPLQRLWGFDETGSRAEEAKKRMETGVKFVSIPLALCFSWLLNRYLGEHGAAAASQVHWFTRSSFRSSLWTIAVMTAGSFASTWIASTLTKKGIGEGKDLILLVGSSLAFGKQIAQLAAHSAGLRLKIERISIALLCAVVLVVMSIYLLESIRRIPVEYPRRAASSPRLMRRVQSETWLPLRWNGGRMQPVTAALIVMAVPAFIVALMGTRGGIFTHGLARWTDQSAAWYWISLASLMIAFTYAYNMAIIAGSFTGPPLAEKLKKEGGYVPNYRPGKTTQDYLVRTTRAFSLPGGFALAFIAAGVPYAVLRITGINAFVTVLSIVIAVETVSNLHSVYRTYRISESYDGFLHRAKRA